MYLMCAPWWTARESMREGPCWMSVQAHGRRRAPTVRRGDAMCQYGGDSTWCCGEHHRENCSLIQKRSIIALSWQTRSAIQYYVNIFSGTPSLSAGKELRGGYGRETGPSVYRRAQRRVLCVAPWGGGAPRRALSQLCSRQAFENTDQMVRAWKGSMTICIFPIPATTTVLLSTNRLIMSTTEKKIMTTKIYSASTATSALHRPGPAPANSSWQGASPGWRDKTINFRSVWEMVHLIESAIDTVSPLPGGGEDPTCFGEIKTAGGVARRAIFS